MSVLSSNNQAKQKLSISKPQQRLFDTFSTKNNLAKECGFIQLVSFNACTFISYLDCLVIYSQCVILFMGR